MAQEEKTLRQLVLQLARENPETRIIKATNANILVKDWYSGRLVSFRTKPHTARTLSARIRIGPDACPKRAQAGYKKAIADTLLLLPHETLLTLDGIYIIRTADDMRALVEDGKADARTLPAKLWNDVTESELSDKLVGVHWFDECSVIVNVREVEALSEKICEYEHEAVEEETAKQFWITLFHELRHVQLDDGVLDFPWLQGLENTEDAVERWARERYNMLFGD